MDDFMIYKYLKGKHMEDQEFMDKFKQAMKVRRDKMRYFDYDYMPKEKHWINNMNKPSHYDDFEDMIEYTRRDGYRDWDSDNMYQRMNYMRHSMENPIDEQFARETVASMYHTENDRKYVGEKFNMHKAKEVKEHYKHMIPSDVTEEEIYLAINAQYHDYCALFKSWNLSNIDHKIIESAIVFWFNDVDYKDKSKVQNYFNN